MLTTIEMLAFVSYRPDGRYLNVVLEIPHSRLGMTHSLGQPYIIAYNMQGGNERHNAPHPCGLSFSLKLLQVLHLLCREELIYTTQVLTHLAVAELVHLGHETIKEVTVVAYAHKRAVKILQRLL